MWKDSKFFLAGLDFVVVNYSVFTLKLHFVCCKIMHIILLFQVLILRFNLTIQNICFSINYSSKGTHHSLTQYVNSLLLVEL